MRVRIRLVIIVSDHGYLSGDNHLATKEAEMFPESCHRHYGIVSMNGPAIKKINAFMVLFSWILPQLCWLSWGCLLVTICQAGYGWKHLLNVTNRTAP